MTPIKISKMERIRMLYCTLSKKIYISIMLHGKLAKLNLSLHWCPQGYSSLQVSLQVGQAP